MSTNPDQQANTDTTRTRTSSENGGDTITLHYPTTIWAVSLLALGAIFQAFGGLNFDATTILLWLIAIPVFLACIWMWLPLPQHNGENPERYVGFHPVEGERVTE